MEVTKKQLADIIGVTERSLTEWQAEGMPVKDIGGKGKSNTYETQEVISWVINRERLKARSNVGGELELDVSGIDAERERKTKLEADILQLKKDELLKNLLPADEVRMALSDLVGAFRSRILSMPSKLAMQLLVADGLAEVTKIIKDECLEALSELSRKPKYED